jgi:hypothetical protein
MFSDSVSLGSSDSFPSALASDSLTKANAEAAIAACFLVAAFFFKRSFCFLCRSEVVKRGDSDFPGGGGLRVSFSSSHPRLVIAAFQAVRYDSSVGCLVFC